MAGYFGAGLAGALQGQNQALANQPEQVARIIQLQGEMQRQALIRKQLADQQAAAGATLNYYGNPPEGAQQTPAPGQPSVPMTVPTSSLPGIAAGQLNAGQPMQQPMAHPAGVGPQNIAPYKSMSDIVGEIRRRNPGMSRDAILAAAGNVSKAEQLRVEEQRKILAQQSLDEDRKARLQEAIHNSEWRERNSITPEERRAAREEAKALRLQLASMQADRQQQNVLSHLNPVSALQEKMLKPIDEAQTQSQEIRGLLASGNPAAAPQVQKLLTLYLQRTRFTNLNYGDQRSFGDVYQRFANAVSRWYAGDYTDANKHQILDMLDTMDSKLMVPARKNVENIVYKRLRAANIPESTARAWSERPATFGDVGAGTPGGDTQSILDQADAIISGKK